MVQITPLRSSGARPLAALCAMLFMVPGAGRADQVADEVRFAGGLIELGMADFAEKVVARLQADHPDRADATRLIRAELAMAYRRFDEAEAQVKNIPASTDEGRTIRLKLANYYYGADQVEKARALYDEFFGQFTTLPTDPATFAAYRQAVLYLTAMLESANQFEQAARTLSRLLVDDIDPEDRRQYTEKICKLHLDAVPGLEGEKRKEALAEVEKGIRDIEFGGPFWVARAMVLRSLKKHAEGDGQGGLDLLKKNRAIFNQVESSFRDEGVNVGRYSPKAGYYYARGVIQQSQGFAAGAKAGTDAEKLAARKRIGRGVGAYTKLVKDYAESDYATEATLRMNECVEEIRRLGGDIKITVNLRPAAPQNVDELFTTADALYREKKFGSAIDAYGKVINQFPDTKSSPRVLTNLAKAYLYEGNELFSRAVTEYMAERYGGDTEAAKGVLKMASFYRKEDAKALVTPAYIAFVDHFPEHGKAPQVLYTLALAEKQAKDEAMAAKLMNRLVNEYPDSEYYLKALWAAGADAYDTAQYEKALEQFDVYAEAAPEGNKKASAMMFAADCRLRLERYAEAFKGFRGLAKALDPSDPNNPYYVQKDDREPNEKLYEQASFQQGYTLSRIEEPAEKVPALRAKAIELYDQFIDRFGRSDLVPKAFAAKGAVMLQLDRFDEATATFETLSQEYPDTPEGKSSLFTLVRSAVEVDKLTVAQAAVDKMALDPAAYGAEMFANVGQLMLNHDLHDQAISAYENMLQATKDSDLQERGYYGLGESYYAKGDCAKAKENLEALLTLNENTGYFFLAKMLLAKAYRDCREYDKAVDAIGAIFRLDQDPVRQTQANFELASIQLAQGRKDAAFASYLRLGLNPDPLRNPDLAPVYADSVVRCMELADELQDWDAVVLMVENLEKSWPKDDRVKDARRMRDKALLEKSKVPVTAAELAP